MSRRNLYWLIGIVAVSLFGFTVSYSAPTRDKEKDFELVRLVVDVLHEVDHKYVQELDSDRKRKLVEDMINGGLERLDPHSMYINSKEYKHFRKTNEGKFGGIGVQVGYDRQNRGQLTVISPMPGTPAYEARSANGDAIQAGDYIVKIDGKSTETMRVSDAVDLIQGDPGQKVVLTVLHEGGKEPFDIPIVRAEIKVQSVMGDLRKPDNLEKWDYFLDPTSKIGYIRLTSFSEKSGQELLAALKELKDNGMRGLVLDLRNNPGGLLSQAVHISNLFLKEGDRIVSTKGRNSHDEVYDARSEDELLQSIYKGEENEKELCAAAKRVSLQPAEKYPVVVLVNRHSASASEIVAAALQDNNRAVIVGERSYGKGSVQNVIPMNKDKDLSALKLTTASYWRPSGKNIHRFPESKETDEWGVKPTAGFEVPMKDDERYEYMQYRSERDVVRTKPKPRKTSDRKDLGSGGMLVNLSGDAASATVLQKMPWGTVWTEAVQQAKGADKFKDRVLEKATEYLKKQM
jgi:carboxyl-terminal processing protease